MKNFAQQIYHHTTRQFYSKAVIVSVETEIINLVWLIKFHHISIYYITTEPTRNLIDKVISMWEPYGMVLDFKLINSTKLCLANYSHNKKKLFY